MAIKQYTNEHPKFTMFDKYKQDKKSLVSFDDFYYWGQILINDFDDIDQSLKNESKVFKVIKHQKEIDESFNFLEEENLERIKSFWNKFFPKMSVNQQNFRKTWKILFKRRRFHSIFGSDATSIQ